MFSCRPFLFTSTPQLNKVKKILNQKIKVEILWWVFTLVLVCIVLLPIWTNVPAFPFYPQNIFFIVAFVSFTRYSFLLPSTLIARAKWIKVFIIAIAVILFFVMTTALIDFNNFLDIEGLQTLVTHLHVHQQSNMINYMKSEMVFFGVGSILSGILLPLRMIVSLWRMRNKGTV